MDPVRECTSCGKRIAISSTGDVCQDCIESTGLATLGAETIIVDGVEALRSLEDEIFSEAPGKYTLIGEHARGGMGRVLLVHDESLGRDVALKELLPGRGSTTSPTPAEERQTRELMARFLREARITGQLEHPSITPVHELGRRGDGSLYYTMKLVKGMTLHKRIQECAHLNERLTLLPHFVDLCNAIAYSHSRNVIHRDIKPANVMVGEYGETVVLDWGLAKVRDAEDDEAREHDAEADTVLSIKDDTPGTGYETTAGQLLGTPVYMAPEQAKGLPADDRSDIYSLGAVLYEILTGRPPHSGKNIQEIIAHVIHDEVEPPQKREKHLQEELNRTCMKALSKNPEDRFASARDLANTIDALKIRPRRSRALKYVRRGITACILAVIVITPILNWVYDKKLKAAYARLEEDGIAVYFDDLENFMLEGLQTVEENPETLPIARRDSVGAVFTLYEQYPISNNLSSPFGESLMSFVRIFEEGRTPTREEVGEMRAFVEFNRPLLDDLHSIAESKGVSREAVEYMIRDIQNPYMLPIPNLMTMRTMTNMMCLEARIQMVDGDYEAAAESLVKTFDFAQKLDANPFLITLMIKLALYDIAFNTLLDIPLNAEISEAIRERLWERVYDYTPYLDGGQSMNREMNVQLWTVHSMKTGKLEEAFMGSNGALANALIALLYPFQFLFDSEEILLIDLNHRQHLAYRKPFIEGKNDLRVIMREVEEVSEFFHPITAIMFPSLETHAYITVDAEQRRNLVLLSLLIRNNFTGANSLPSSVDAIAAPEGLDMQELKRCLVSDTPVQLRVDGNDLVIYSFGQDDDDDKGEGNSIRPNPNGAQDGDILIRVPILGPVKATPAEE